MSSPKSYRPPDSRIPSVGRMPCSVRPSSRSALLEALEEEVALSRRQIAESSGLSPTTVRKVATDLVHRGILTFCDGYDKQSGRPCQWLVPGNTHILPILDMSEPRMEARLVDMHLHTVAAAVMEYNHTVPPTDNLRLLCQRAYALTVCCPDRLLAEPLLLLPDDRSTPPPTETATSRSSLHPRRLSAAIEDEVGASPLAVIHAEAAVSHALRYSSLSPGYRFLLYLRVGATNRASLLVREPSTTGRDKWATPSCGRILPTALERHLADLRPHTAPWVQGIQRFLSDFCSFCMPDCILIDRADGTSPTAEELRPYIPAEIELLLPLNRPDIPTTAQLGAARMGRRILWERMLR